MYKGYRTLCGMKSGGSSICCVGEKAYYRILEISTLGVIGCAVVFQVFCYHGVFGLLEWWPKSWLMGILIIVDMGWLALCATMRVISLIVVSQGTDAKKADESELTQI